MFFLNLRHITAVLAVTGITFALAPQPAEAELVGLVKRVVSDVYGTPPGFDREEKLPRFPVVQDELLETGKVQAAISAADDLLLKRSKGIHAVGVWPAFQLNPQGLMVHVSTRIARFEDIPDGSTIAIEVGSPFQTFLWNQQGWEGKVKAVPYGGQVGVFLADPATIQQAYITSEPCIARSQGAEVTFLKAADAGWNPYGSLLALPEPLPAWAPQFVEATHRSWEAYGADPGRGNAEISRLNEQMKPELIGCITDAQRPFVAGTDGMGSMTGERWEAVAATLVEQKLLPPGSTAAGAWKVLR